MAHCDEYLELISAAVDGALSPEEEAALTAHLVDCASCRALLSDLQDIHAQLSALPPVEVPADLTDRVMAAVAAEAAPKVVPLPAKKPVHWKRWGSLAAVLALVLLGGGYQLSRLNAGSSSAPAPAAAEPVSPPLLDAAEESLPAPASAEKPIPEAAATDAPVPNEMEAGESFDASKTSPFSNTAAPASAPAATQSHNASLPASHKTTASGGSDSAVVQTPPPMLRSFALPAPEPEAPLSEESAPEAPDLETPELQPFTTMAADPAANGIAATPSESAPALTAQEAAECLANYIYEFVETVEPTAPEGTDPLVWRLSCPTGVSGDASLLEETGTTFRFVYTDAEGGQALLYGVDKADGAVTYLGPKLLRSAEEALRRLLAEESSRFQGCGSEEWELAGIEPGWRSPAWSSLGFDGSVIYHWLEYTGTSSDEEEPSRQFFLWCLHDSLSVYGRGEEWISSAAFTVPADGGVVEMAGN